MTYAYDAVGRRTQIGGSFARTNLPQPIPAATYDAGNQLLQWGSSALAYDSNGNLVSDGLNQYTWNARNQLASMSGGTAAAFQYDAYSRRSSKTIAGATTGFLYDGVNAVQELSGTTPTANMLSGSIDEIFMRTDSTRASSFLMDGLGSTLALTSGSGSIASQYTYEPFGSTSTVGNSSGNSFQYTGRENDGTGLYYYRARYYDPQIGRFISEDPLRFRAGVNFYMYVLNDPILLVDPLGFCPANTHEATTTEAAKILAAANRIVSEGLSYKNIKCNQFVDKSINKALPGALSQEYNVRQIGQGQGPFDQTDSPAVGELALFNTPGHVTLITQMRNGQVSQFVGSQTSTGPEYVNLPDYYWQGKLNANGNVRYYRICLPN